MFLKLVCICLMVLMFLIIRYVLYYLVLMCLINNMCIMSLAYISNINYSVISTVTSFLLFSW